MIVLLLIIRVLVLELQLCMITIMYYWLIRIMYVIYYVFIYIRILYRIFVVELFVKFDNWVEDHRFLD